MSLDNIKVGDKVTVRWNGIEGFTEVTKVGKSKVTTADGRMWKRSGYQWGSAAYYGPWIDVYDPQDDIGLADQQRERRRTKLAVELSEFRWRNLPYEVLLAVKALLPEGDS